ncbi:MAG: DUF2249 domain-containing protein [Planctomycetes bacterium]|jgi:uncharacterized protein (DUF2249 family)|nr:DUF2249 domain-containing protein [Planctomycetota bacterium]MBT4027787.1 DUF2249 domain-containing protein [Planctomycetota bacterium]MBT4559324.1 DUF2249 domain-containing protein [Planctomycetota bacterium]MBT5100963.1 DUF2249 domain-containing protein [Planctomycetota bacterium]MBT5120663.1 DUF2249 domain-containing protein [Planctomycetota bacterium]
MNLPEKAVSAGVARVRDLDVRPTLAQGIDPFTKIMAAAAELESDECLRLIVGFKPKPLYLVMRSRGFASHTAQNADGDFEVLFWKKPGGGGGLFGKILGGLKKKETAPPSAEAREAIAARAATDSQEVVSSEPPIEMQPPEFLDVRGLEPPEPMMQILAKLDEMGPTSQLMIDHHREPLLLYAKLEEKGFASSAEEVEAGHWKIHIFPASLTQENNNE